MINDTFFPTPHHVITKMLAPLSKTYEIEGRTIHRFSYRRILDPSAGKGDILEYIKDVYRMDASKLFCIEIEPELQMILTGKGFKLIDTDFLHYADQYQFDLIAMNPPFNDGASHLLQAWDILCQGDIVCILNAETVLNPYTKERKLLKQIIDEHGHYEEIGAVFSEDAERKTDVNCVIVWLRKEPKQQQAKPNLDFGVQSLEWDSEVSETEFTASEIAPTNLAASLVAQYTQAAKLLTEIHGLRSQYRFYTAGIFDSVGDDEKQAESLNDQIDGLKQQFWNYIFKRTKLGQITTSNYQEKFKTFSEQTARLAFSEANIMRIMEMFIENQNDIVLECIGDVFDRATSFHEKNCVHVEGWKTNKSWKIAPKIIMPNGITHEPKWNGWSMSSWRKSYQFFSDIDKALCFLSGKKLDDIQKTVDVMENRLRELARGMHPVGHDAKFLSTYFELRIYKKGTVHMTFRDPDLLARFNITAAQQKGWLGGGAGF